MRVLFSSTAGHGHVFPLVPLARACQAAGHEVLWAGHSSVGELLAEAGLPFAPAGLQGMEFTDTIAKLRLQARTFAPTERTGFVFPNGFGAALPPAMAASLIGLGRDWPADLLVHEQAELAAPLAAAVLGVPSVMQSYGGAIPPELLCATAQRLAPLWHTYDRSMPDFAGCFESLFIDICPPSIRPVPLDHIARVQPMQPASYTGSDTTVPAGMRGGEGPLIYLTLGTIPGTTATLASTLAAISALPVRVLVTVGPEGDPAALPDQPDNVTVSRYVSQSRVLKDCSLVVSHAGSGTFLGALGHGVAQLCLPQAADQFRNAVACVKAGAGLALTPEQATAEAISSAVRNLLADPGYRAAAARIQAEIDTLPAPADVVPVLTRLAG